MSDSLVVIGSDNLTSSLIDDRMPPARRLQQDELFYDPVKVEDEDSNQRINNAQNHRSATGI